MINKVLLLLVLAFGSNCMDVSDVNSCTSDTVNQTPLKGGAIRIASKDGAIRL